MDIVNITTKIIDKNEKLAYLRRVSHEHKNLHLSLLKFGRKSSLSACLKQAGAVSQA